MASIIFMQMILYLIVYVKLQRFESLQPALDAELILCGAPKNVTTLFWLFCNFETFPIYSLLNFLIAK